MIANKSEIVKLKKEFKNLVFGFKTKVTKEKIEVEVSSQWLEDDFADTTIFLNGHAVDGIEAISAKMTNLIEKTALAKINAQEKHNLKIKKFINKTKKYENYDEIWNVLWETV